MSESTFSGPSRVVLTGGAHDQLTSWLVAVLAETLQMDPQSIHRDVPLWEYGMDSLVAATLLAELDDELGVWVDPGDVRPGISLNELAALILDDAPELLAPRAASEVA